jgi:hypothetical protein
MPTETIIIVSFVVAAFLAFAVALTFASITSSK